MERSGAEWSGAEWNGMVTLRLVLIAASSSFLFPRSMKEAPTATTPICMNMNIARRSTGCLLHKQNSSEHILFFILDPENQSEPIETQKTKPHSGPS